MLKIAIETVGGSTLLKCAGRIVHGEESAALQEAVLSRNELSVEIDLADVQGVDAAGLGTLVFLQHEFARDGRELVLVSPQQFFLVLLRLTGLEEVLTVRERCFV